MRWTRAFGAGACAIVAAGASLYVILQRPNAESSIVQLSRCGHGNVAPRVIQQDYGAIGLAVDAKYPYFGDADGLMRMAK